MTYRNQDTLHYYNLEDLEAMPTEAKGEVVQEMIDVLTSEEEPTF